MDQISYAHSAKQSKRIKRFIAEPDSTSGLVSLPKVIEAGENITIPDGRVVVHPNLEIDGTLTIENDGELFVPFGGTLVSSDLMHPVDTIDDLRNETGKYKYIYVTGYHTKDEGAFGSNMFVWDEDSTETDNGGTIIKCTTVTTGRYKLKYSGAVNVKWFGAKGDWNGTTGTDDTIAVRNAIKYAVASSETLAAPSGRYLITGQLLIDEIKTDSSKSFISIKGYGSKKSEFVFKDVNNSGLKIEGDYQNGKYWLGEISGLRLSGVNSKRGLDIISFPYGIIRDVVIENFNEDGFWINQSNSLRWYDSTSQLNGHNGGVVFDQSNAAIRMYNVAFNSNGLNGLVCGLNTSFVPTITISIALNNLEFSNNGTNATVPKTGYLTRTADLHMFGARDCMILSPYFEWYPKPQKDSYGTANTGYVHYNAIRTPNTLTFDSINNTIFNPDLKEKVRSPYITAQARIDGSRGLDLVDANYTTVVGGNVGSSKSTSTANYFYGTYGDLSDVALSDSELNIFANPEKGYLFDYLSAKIPQNLVMNGKADAYSGTKLVGWTRKSGTTLSFTDGVSISTTINYGGIEQLIPELDVGTYTISFDYLTNSPKNIVASIGSNTVSKSILFSPTSDGNWHTYTFTFTINSLSEIDNIKKLNFFGMLPTHAYSSSYSVKNVVLTKGTLSYPFFPSYKDASLDLSKGYIKAPDGSYWNLTITNLGVITPVKLV